MAMNQYLAAWYQSHLDGALALADDLWANPELGLHTHCTAAAVAEYLEAQGFTVTRYDIGDTGTPNCPVARWGSGHPVIGFVGDMDAYPNVGNRKAPCEDRVEGPGQGCGHNLNTVAGVAAACALKNALEAEGRPGTVLFFGCPAEESIGGKLPMVRDGLFDGVDVCYQWHSSGRQIIFGEIAVASVQRFNMTFIGDDSAAPPLYYGRTAQDAAELMAVGLGYMRKEFPTHMFNLKNEWLPRENGYQDRLSMMVEVRFNDYAVTSRCVDRILQIAKGAAVMTGTKVEWQATVVYRDLIANHALNESAYRAALKVPPIVYDAADEEYAETLYRNINGRKPTPEDVSRVFNVPEWYREKPDGTPELLMCEPQKPKGCQWIQGGGTDLAEVSYRCPVIFISGPGVPAGVPGHSWAVTSASAAAIGHKAMRFGSQTMAQAAYDLATDPALFAAVRAEFATHSEKTAGYRTNLPLPGGSFDPASL